MESIDRPVLVLGATGKTGSRVYRRLADTGVPVRAGSRSGGPAFHWQDPDTWPAALRGASAVYLTFLPDLAVPGALDTVARFAEQARDAGVTRIVMLSARGEPAAVEGERRVRESGVALTVLRCAWFMQNFDEGFLREPLLSGQLALPVGDTPEPFIDADDIADVAVAALRGDEHIGRVYELTGPRLLTFADTVDEIAQATGREIGFASVPLETFRTALSAAYPSEEVELVCWLFTELFDGRNATATDGVREALGRPAHDFGDYLRKIRATGAWRASPATAG